MPKISVILPVYNAEKYLREAIDSILAQTFTDFELLLINDGSTDGSEAIILSYADSRIVYIKNEVNQGLIFSLNKAIDIAEGKYIARMDADDVAMPARFEKQVMYLDSHPTDVLATTVQPINEGGKPLAAWADDVNHTTYKQIKRCLLKDNCIGHPTVMGKNFLFKSYKYQANQKYSEDYDLWLRMIADGLLIEKLSEPLVWYRMLPNSVTRFKKVNIFFRLAKVKFRFFKQRLTNGRLSFFISKVLLFACFDLLKAAGKEVKAMFTK